jgi:hypothetical protein
MGAYHPVSWMDARLQTFLRNKPEFFEKKINPTVNAGDIQPQKGISMQDI